jgi:hypothetical protein
MARRCVVGSFDGGGRVDSTGSLSGLSAEMLNADAYCTGFWDRCAQEACRWLAAVRIVGAPRSTRSPDRRLTAGAAEIDLPVGRMAEVLTWHAAMETLRTQVVSDADVDAVVAGHELDWTWFDLEELELASLSAAREALLCDNEDHVGVEEIVRRSGASHCVRTVRSDALDPSLGAPLVAAPVDVGLGPFGSEGSWTVVWVRRRTRPDAGDPEVRAAVEAELIARVVDRELVGAVRWDGPL